MSVSFFSVTDHLFLFLVTTNGLRISFGLFFHGTQTSIRKEQENTVPLLFTTQLEKFSLGLPRTRIWWGEKREAGGAVGPDSAGTS